MLLAQGKAVIGDVYKRLKVYCLYWSQGNDSVPADAGVLEEWEAEKVNWLRKDEK